MAVERKLLSNLRDDSERRFEHRFDVSREGCSRLFFNRLYFSNVSYLTRSLAIRRDLVEQTSRRLLPQA